MSRVVSVARVDVFTDRPFAGNPAAAPRPDADHGLRKFTPTREVAYSGHTTLGAVRTLLDAGRLSSERVVFATTQGVLPVAIEARADGSVLWL